MHLRGRIFVHLCCVHFSWESADLGVSNFEKLLPKNPLVSSSRGVMRGVLDLRHPKKWFRGPLWFSGLLGENIFLIAATCKN